MSMYRKHYDDIAYFISKMSVSYEIKLDFAIDLCKVLSQTHTNFNRDLFLSQIKDTDQ